MTNWLKKPIPVMFIFAAVMATLAGSTHEVLSALRKGGWWEHAPDGPWWVWSILFGLGAVFWLLLALSEQVEKADRLAFERAERTASEESLGRLVGEVGDLKTQITEDLKKLIPEEDDGVKESW